jgi:hypothetical protein
MMAGVLSSVRCTGHLPATSISLSRSAASISRRDGLGSRSTTSVIRAAFKRSAGIELSAGLDLPAGPMRAYALFAHCFTCTKDLPRSALRPPWRVRALACCASIAPAPSRFDSADHFLTRKADAELCGNTDTAWALPYLPMPARHREAEAEG